MRILTVYSVELKPGVNFGKYPVGAMFLSVFIDNDGSIWCSYLGYELDLPEARMLIVLTDGSKLGESGGELIHISSTRSKDKQIWHLFEVRE